MRHLDTLGRINVGPESAGSSPGPACYGFGGDRPTVTDADLLLGKLDPVAFAGGTMTLDAEQARAAVAVHLAEPMAVDVATAAAGLIEIVDENMANATRVHATDHGDEIESRVLIATGGAAPLHAGRIAQKLGIAKVVVPTGAGVGSAHGFLRAPVAYEAVHSHFMPLASFDPDVVNDIFHKLRLEASRIVELARDYGQATERRFADMRYRGQGHELTVEIPARAFLAADATVLADLFAGQYRKNFNRTIPNLGVEVMTWTLVLSRKAPAAADHMPFRSAGRFGRVGRVGETGFRPRERNLHDGFRLAAKRSAGGIALLWTCADRRGPDDDLCARDVRRQASACTATSFSIAGAE